MLLIDGMREVLYQVVQTYYKSNNVNPSVLELGVHQGANAVNLYNIFKPGKLDLVDSWDAGVISDAYSPGNPDVFWVDGLEARANYYGGDIQNQHTLDNNMKLCQRKVSDFERVNVIKSKSIDYLKQCAENNHRYDVIYVDGSHDYEDVLVDLMWASKISEPNGWILLNDCCHSQGGVKQNLGVLEACIKFCKMENYVPVLVARSDWTDVALTRINQRQIEDFFIRVLIQSDIGFCQVPSSLLPHSKVVNGKRHANFLFGY